MLAACLTGLQAQNVEMLTTLSGASFRGIACWGDEQIWVSGSGGKIGRSIDAGKTWHWISPAGYEAFDFRDIEVFSENAAVVLSAGSPAVILTTQNGGESWTEVFRDTRAEIFLDGMEFDGNHGFIIGDPIDGAFQLLESKDRGKTWDDVSNVMYLFADDGEVAFAASGTSLHLKGKNLYLGTGGVTASLFTRKTRKPAVIKIPVPIIQGIASTGIFSIDCWDQENIIAVGGDYMNDTVSTDAALISYDGGYNWKKPETTTSGYKSCVKYLTKERIIATGTSGTDISNDGGLNWRQISKDSFHCLAKGKSGDIVYLAGDKHIAKITF
ncbi:MAG: WD40/YVTN/BNR-like repeat-containing protein [Sphingobacterium sp.]|uniref:WD40/YVTN/BNR-like repeat-containing protein n=1 Tax=Sphingobacterium sp. JB170 TaxID=1434842 RepID=UPI000B34B059|nr:YCF48-related protein [Sphingobacterium sp. JB170]